jgi:hypothetical protein
MSRGKKKVRLYIVYVSFFWPNYVPHQFSLTSIPHVISMGIYLGKLLVLVECNVNGINLI